jgi:hypothetical protein
MEARTEQGVLLLTPAFQGPSSLPFQTGFPTRNKEVFIMQLTSCDAQAKFASPLRTSVATKKAEDGTGVTRSRLSVSVKPKVVSRPAKDAASSVFAPAKNSQSTDHHLGKSSAAGKSSKPGIKPSTVKPSTGFKSPRKENGQFYSPFKKIISDYVKEVGDADLRNRLEESDLAHRMSFQNIHEVIDGNVIGSDVIEDLIKTLTIPSRDFGTWKAGDERLYRFVKQKEKDKGLLTRMLNSSPFNLRPGDSSTNRSIGKRLDPNLNASGRITPLSRSVSKYGEEYANTVTPPQPFEPASHDPAVNVDPECEQSYRSSTSVKESELAAFETFVCKRMEELVRGNFAGIYLEAAK